MADLVKVELRRRLPRRYRYALPLASRIMGDLATVTLFRVGPMRDVL